ncbi:methionine ABC transporter permease [Sneathia sanguinegens]|uniref:methionine ABC transporter permease n=1 Tax=Sneathia sanguinegens TaxID=40543 RepID=UPI0023F6B00E|nr:ABC transporter permease subunit [Sneathia sanguinegens]
MDYELMQALRETIIMILIPTLVSIIFGLPIGACIYLKNRLSIFCNIYVNVVRSVPYLLFVIILIPLTRLLFSTAFGVLPATLPLCFVGVATFSRFVEQSFGDVNKGVIELAESMKVSKYQLVRYFLIVESRQSLVLGLTSTIISIISYSTVMGIVGAGGIGDYAIRYGYYEFNMQVVYKAIIYIVILVFIIQIVGKKISELLDKKGSR